ncbi:MAG: hypothetical protein IPJ41_01990 [Phycisphaerales bacterium]|nr:hypothetical protein [Phycisphaerales bacterium]
MSAKRAMTGMAVVGLCERVDAAADAIARALHLPPPAPIEHLNPALSPLARDELSPRVVRRVRELTALDQEIYNLAAGSRAIRAGSLESARATPPSYIPS